MADKLGYPFPPEAKERGNRLVAELCGLQQSQGGPRFCGAPLKCSDYPAEHAKYGVAV